MLNTRRLLTLKMSAQKCSYAMQDYYGNIIYGSFDLTILNLDTLIKTFMKMDCCVTRDPLKIIVELPKKTSFVFRTLRTVLESRKGEPIEIYKIQNGQWKEFYPDVFKEEQEYQNSFSIELAKQKLSDLNIYLGIKNDEADAVNVFFVAEEIISEQSPCLIVCEDYYYLKSP